MGKMPEYFVRRGARIKPEFFKDGTKLDWPKRMASQQSKKEVRATGPLRVSVVFQVRHHFYFASRSALSDHLRQLLTHTKLKIRADSAEGAHQRAFLGLGPEVAGVQPRGETGGSGGASTSVFPAGDTDGRFLNGKK